MKNLLIILVLLAPIVHAQGAAEYATTSEIKEVTVYHSCAFITRETKLQIAKGLQEYRITGLSPYVTKESLQVLGTGDIVIHGFHYELRYTQPIKSNIRVKTLIEEIQELENEIQRKQLRVGVLEEQKDLLDKNKRLNEAGLSVQELMQLVDYFNEKLTSIHTEILDIQNEIKGLEADKQTWQNELNQLNQTEKTPSGEIVLQIEGRQETSSTLEISYLTSQAAWSPAYDIRVPEVDGDIELVLKASLLNNTREDWKNVSLVFSNGNPNYSGVLPVLNTWYLDIRHQVYRRDMGAGKKSAMPAAVQMAMEQEDAFESPSYKQPETTIREQQTSVEYKLDQPYTLLSNNQAIQVDLTSHIVPATYTYYAVPKLDKSAYLVARIENWDQPGLLDGPANLYFENRYVGKTFVNSRQLSTAFDISLGSDKSIFIERELTDTYHKKNLIGTDGIDRKGYTITVKNTKSTGINLVLYDQLPVSANSEITVKTLDTGHAQVNDVTGKLTWNLTVGARESEEVSFGYEVKYPKDEWVLLN